MIEVTIQRSKDDVREALIQFCARRGYRLSDPWYLEGLRIEVPNRSRDGFEKRGFWATVTDAQTGPRIDVDVKRRRARSSRVRINVGDHTDSVRLAYELQAYLNDDRSYDAACPPICTSCGSNVPNPIARYCGRCGHRFASGSEGGDKNVLRPPLARAETRDRPRDDETMSEWLLERKSEDNERQPAEKAPDDHALDIVDTEYAADDESGSSDVKADQDELAYVDSEYAADDETSLKGGVELTEPQPPVAEAASTANEPVAEPVEAIAEAMAVEDDEIGPGSDDDEGSALNEAGGTSESEEDSVERDGPRPTRRLLAEE
ncbi:MAG: hypothetical protein H6819_11505 [Phycisphaerales bacterium]|nr:hypothetical protein [Phycisphaerales bacterium]MCB9856804.1 hypothetical protein [Phycisphaerales bacterium]MCB9862069.1 hypothetical protein [Phycisphaerales bacterium]